MSALCFASELSAEAVSVASEEVKPVVAVVVAAVVAVEVSGGGILLLAAELDLACEQQFGLEGPAKVKNC